MQGYTADEIAEKLNAAGYRIGSKRFGERLFTNDTVWPGEARCESSVLRLFRLHINRVAEGNIASLPHSSTAGEDGPLLDKRRMAGVWQIELSSRKLR